MRKTLFTLGMLLSMSALQADQFENGYQLPVAENTYNSMYDCCENFTVGADYLYWKTEQTGLIVANETTVTNSGNTFTSKPIRPSFKYDSGYRIFADYTTSDSLWKYCLTFTHAPSTAKSSFSSDEFTEFATVFPVNIPLLTILSGTSLNGLDTKWKSCLNYLDFDVSRKFNVCQNLEIAPHMGVRVMWMHQRLNIDMTFVPDIGPLVSFNSVLRSNFTAVGLEGGLKGTWKMCDDLSFIGHIGGSLLYSNFHTCGDLANVTVGATPYTNSYKNSSHRAVPTFDSFIGLQYTPCLWGYSANVHVGWEQHVLFQTNDFSLSDTGSTTLQGLTVGAGFNF